MLKLPKKKIKLPKIWPTTIKKIWLIIISLTVGLTACADVPIKPIVNRCEIDKAANICRCHLTGGAPGPTIDEPLEFCDGFVAHSLDDTGKMDDYAHKMENYIKANCGGPTNPNSF